MSSPSRDLPIPASRPILTRDRIVAAAVALVDEAGPDALTMRAVAGRLDAGAMSLYRHVTSRDELLDLVLLAMTAAVPSTPLSGDWRADLAAVARDVRAGLVARPHLTVLLTSRSGSGGQIPLLDRTLGVLRDAGFSPREAAFANHALGNLVAGAALWEAVGLAGTTGEDRANRRRAIGEALAALPADRFPGIAWAGSELVTGTADDRFEFGLAVILDGLAARLAPAAAWTGSPIDR